MRNSGARLGLAGLMGIALAAPALGKIIYVDDIAPGGDGTTWATAYSSLQTALTVAAENDEIRIGQGTYKPAPTGGDQNLAFTLKNGLTLRGGYAGFGAASPDA